MLNLAVHVRVCKRLREFFGLIGGHLARLEVFCLYTTKLDHKKKGKHIFILCAGFETMTSSQFLSVHNENNKSKIKTCKPVSLPNVYKRVKLFASILI
jgi:hypothetical protein